MSAIQDLEPYISAYQGRFRKAKDASRMTLEELADQSGVSYSAVSRLYAGSQSDPRLYNSAALCKVLGLSLDELFGLTKPAGSPEELKEQNRKLELENARLTAANMAHRAQIRSTHAICYLLSFFCTVLAVSLIIYLVIDSQISDAGIIRGGKLSLAAWVFVGLIVGAVFVAGFAIVRIIRREHMEGGEHAMHQV